MKTEISLDIQAQPNDETCGATCLHALYRFYGVDDLSLDKLIKQIGRLSSGGTLAEILACHALERGFHARIYTYHLQMFDPSWFASDGEVHDPDNVIFCLKEQAKLKKANRRLKMATRAFVRFFELEGELKLEDLTPRLIARYLSEGVPIIAGLSSTFLYREPREISPHNTPDDVRGEPQGHFVMLVGYDSERREVVVADPLDENPPFYTNKYRLDIDRLVNAILLGAYTHDANLLVITPKVDPDGRVAHRKAAPAKPATKERAGHFAKPTHKPVTKPSPSGPTLRVGSSPGGPTLRGGASPKPSKRRAIPRTNSASPRPAPRSSRSRQRPAPHWPEADTPPDT